MPRSFRSGTGVAVCTAGALLFAPLIATPAYAAPSETVVINEVYVNGGSAGATHLNKFVELQNLSSAPVTVDGWSLRYRAATGAAAPTGRVELTGTIPAGGTYLIGGTSNAANGVALPATNATIGASFAGAGGTLLLTDDDVFDTAAVLPTGDVAGAPGVVDLIGYGTSGTREGAAAATGQSVSASLSRVLVDGVPSDTDQNAVDFAAGTPTPTTNSTIGGTTPDPEPAEPTPGPTEPVDPLAKSIAEIQGAGASTPVPANQRVTTQGVVTAKYDQGGFSGYYLQTEGTGASLPTEGSHGIFVYSAATLSQVAVGDFVELSGLATEYQGLTQLTSIEGVQKLAEPFTQPVPLDIPVPTTDAAREAIEGMLILPTDDFTISGIYGADQYGTIGLAVGDEPLVQPTAVGPVGSPEHAAVVAKNAASKVLLDDGSSNNYWNGSRNGSTPMPWVSPQTPLSIGTGVTFEQPVIFDVRFNEWSLQPTSFITGESTTAVPVQFTAVERDAAVGEVGGDISVANFNVLNYFTTTGGQLGCKGFADRQGALITTDGCDARGASTQESLKRQADKIVSAINQLDASVVGLSEIENSIKFGDDRDAALADLVERLNLAAGEERWAFVPSPTAVPAAADEDFIRNALIYQQDVVAPVGESSILIGSPAFSNAREPLAQVFRPVGGEASQDTAVIVNHFKSKSASGASGENADAGEGAWTADRKRQAEALVAFAKSVQENAGTERALLIGDFNSYAYEAPLAVLKDAGYVNVGQTTGKHTYSFDEMVGSLDHVFASAGTTVTGADIWNINSTESTGFEYSKYNYNVVDLYDAGPFRSSDHDPVKVGLDLSAEPETTTIQVLSFNDLHGHIAPSLSSGEIGAAGLAGAFDAFRAQNPNTLVVSAGDSIGGSPFISSSQQDDPTIDALVAAGLDASVVGNHEFDRGYDDLVNRVIPRYEAGNTTGQSDFALGANVYRTDGSRALRPYTIQEVDGVRVAIIGTVTESTPTVVAKGGIVGLEFRNAADEANAVAQQLTEGDLADVIIHVTHEGAETRSAPTLTDVQYCAEIENAPNAFGEIVSEADASIDAIISAHSHQRYNCEIDGRPVVQALEYGKYLNQLEFTVDNATGDVTATAAQVQLVTPADNTTDPVTPAKANFTDDAEVARIVATAKAESDVIGSVEIGTVSESIMRARNGEAIVRDRESTMGNFIADVQLWATSAENSEYAGALDSEIAIMNPGGLRDDILFGTDGTVTYGQVAVAQPFANSLFTMDLTAEQLDTVLEQQWRGADGSTKLHLGLSANVDYVYDQTAPLGSRVSEVEVDGQPVADTVRVTTNSFLAAGGDSFTALASGSNRADAGIVDLDALVHYFESVDEACGVVSPSAVGRARLAGEQPTRGAVLSIIEECTEGPGTPGNPGNPGTPGTPGTPGAGSEKPTTNPVAALASALTAALENLITSDDRSLSAGETIRIFVGQQFAGQWVQVWLYSEPVLLSDGWVQVAADGYVTVQLPDELPAGAHRLAVLDANGDVIGWQSVTVADTGVAGLPDTGAQVAPVLVFASLMLAAGAVLVIARRRRSQLA